MNLDEVEPNDNDNLVVRIENMEPEGSEMSLYVAMDGCELGEEPNLP